MTKSTGPSAGVTQKAQERCNIRQNHVGLRLDEVSAYAIDKQNGHITALNRQSCGGKNPVHLSTHPTDRWIVTANYSAGSVGVVPIEKDGILGPRVDLVNLLGEPGPDGKRQTSSHPHDAVFDPSGRFLAVPDLGFDRIFVFRLDAASGKLAPNDPPFVATSAGAGPGHIAFHPKMPLAHVINELGSSVTTYRFDPQRGSLHPIQIVPSTRRATPARDHHQRRLRFQVLPQEMLWGERRGQGIIVAGNNRRGAPCRSRMT